MRPVCQGILQISLLPKYVGIIILEICLTASQQNHHEIRVFGVPINVVRKVSLLLKLENLSNFDIIFVFKYYVTECL